MAKKKKTPREQLEEMREKRGSFDERHQAHKEQNPGSAHTFGESHKAWRERNPDYVEQSSSRFRMEQAMKDREARERGAIEYRYRNQPAARNPIQAFKPVQKKEQSAWDIFVNALSRAGNAGQPEFALGEGVRKMAEDDSYKRPSEMWTKDQLKVYQDLLSDQDAADRYAIDVNNAINKAIRQAKGQKIAGQATDGFWKGAGHTAASILAAPTGVADSALMGLEKLVRGEVTEKDYISPSDYAGTVQGSIAGNLNDHYGTVNKKVPVIGGKGVGDLYSLGVSTANAGLHAALGGGFAKAGMETLGKGVTYASFFGQTAPTAFREAKERGASDDQALAFGYISGLVEGITEEVSIKSLLGIKSADTFKGFFRNVLHQAGEEGTEEVMADVLDGIADQLILGDKSEMSTAARDYMAAGMNTEDAWKQAWKDFANQAAWDYVGGAVSGAALGGLETGRQNIWYRNTYSESAPDLIQQGMESPEGTASRAEAERANAKMEGGKKLSGSDIHRMVDANEEQFQKEEESIQEAISKVPGITREGANALTDSFYGTGVDAFVFSQGIQEAANYAMHGYSEEEAIERGASVRDLTDEQRSIAFEIGRQAASRRKADLGTADQMGRSGVGESYATKKAGTHVSQEELSSAYQQGRTAAQQDAAAKQVHIEGLANGKTGWREGTVRGEGVKMADLRKTFNDPQNKSYDILRTFSAATGVDVVLFKSQTDENGNFIGEQGRFKPDEDTIYIDLNAGLKNVKDANDLAKYSMLRTFSHEFTHFTEKWSPAEYDSFRTTVFDAITEAGENVDDLIEMKMADDSQLSYEKASREVIAEAMTDILPDSHFIEQLAQKDKTGFEKLRAKLKDFLSQIKDYFRNLGHNKSREAAALKKEIDGSIHYLEDIVKEFDKLAVSAVESYQQANAVEEAAPVENVVKEVEKPAEEVKKPAEEVKKPAEEVKKPTEEVKKEVEKAPEHVEKPTESVKPITSENGFTVMPGTKEGFVQVQFSQKPDADVIDRLKADKFHWSRANKVWYGKGDMQAVKERLDNVYEGFDVLNVDSQEILDKLEDYEKNGHPTVKRILDEATRQDAAFPKQSPQEQEAQPEAPAAEEKPEDVYSEIGKALQTSNEYYKGWLVFSVQYTPGANVYTGSIKENQTGRYVEDARAFKYQGEDYKTRQEAVDEIEQVARFNDLLRPRTPAAVAKSATTTEAKPAAPAEKPMKEEVKNVETEDAPVESAVPEPPAAGAGAARLLDGVETGTVSAGGEGRGPVQSPELDGAADAGRSGQADAAGSGQVSGEGDRLGGRVQQLTDQEKAQKKEDRKAELHEEVTREIEQKSKPEPKGTNFTIGDSLDLPRGEKARTRANIDAIRLVKQLEAEGRMATAEEQKILSKYVGWGGLPKAFGETFSNRETHRIDYRPVSGYEKEFEELKNILSDEEYESARGSAKNAHYTSIDVIKAMYDGLKRLGFTGGRMLEPSGGVGNFIGAMPADMSSDVKSWTLVELDGITGKIAKYLYPQADVRIQGFEKTNIPDNYMDVAIGNVPFGNYGISDKHYPKSVTNAIHNYFFAKALDKVRPGGLVMFITSSYTMNSNDSSVRKYIADRADLLGAIRLPNTAFSGNAGTSVVTDIMILKKRKPRTAYAGEKFQNSEVQHFNDGYAYVNEYFEQHPSMVLGTPAIKRGMYSSNELTYDPITDVPLGDQIKKAMSSITEKMDYDYNPTPEQANRAQAREKRKANRLKVEGKTIKAVDEHGNEEVVKADGKTAERIIGMVGIRDAYNNLMDAMQQGMDKRSVNRYRKILNERYDAFVGKYKALNDSANKRAINQFADRYAILSLENYDADTKTATKTDVFSKNTVSPNVTATSAENVEEGLTISMNTTGRVDVDQIAMLTGESKESVKRQLIDQRLVFKDKDGNLIPAIQYLSGNVRAKLRDMEGLVSIDPDYKNNVEALREVVPETVPYTDISINPGANWVPTSVYEDFVAHIMQRYNHEDYRTGKKTFSIQFVPETNSYKFDINDSYAKNSAQNKEVWGAHGKYFREIFENILNGKHTNVWTGPKDNRVIDKVATAAVADKAEKITEEFQRWIWDDEDRRPEMERLYNDIFNSVVTPQYDGEHLTVNGLNSGFKLYPHQKAAVSRILNSGGNTLLAHRVGAGKTLEMASAAMKLKELGVVKKPMFVVPNNVVAQWGKEFKDYFPAANIFVVGDTDMTPAERMTTINKIKNNDYDAVILAYTKFERIPMTKEWREKFYGEQINNIVYAINAEKEATGQKGFTVKQLEKKKAQLEKKISDLTSGEKDEDGAMFEDLGVDALFVDEAHNFKNLEYTTRMHNVSGLGSSEGSKRAFDLYTKIRYLQQLNGGRGIVFATATPVMNSMTEMYIMQRYLQPDKLAELGIENFDAWAKQFGEVVNALEIAPSGSGYRLKETFSKFKNVKGLQQLFRSFTDVVTDLPYLKIPKMKGGKVQIVECEAGEFQKEYMKALAERSENVRNVDPKEDNMLKITSDGRKISYSQRMIDPSLPYEENGKIYTCCNNVYKVYQESMATKGTQMIFCDMATPKGSDKKKTDKEDDSGEFDEIDEESAHLYDDIKSRLVQLGIPKNEIAFIHDAKNDKQKAALSQKMNEGKIRVLIGSTGKMGVGLNAQKKAIAIHHLDAPWRPGDIEQRDGRVFRQRNENPEAYKFVYVTKGSFDARLWDILDRKSKFINQVMSGNDVGNEIEDTGMVTLSAAEVKAIASDNPLILEEVKLAKDIDKLTMQQAAHATEVNRAKAELANTQRDLAYAETKLSKTQEDIAHTRKDTYSSDDKFSIEIDGETIRGKKEAGLYLIAAEKKVTNADAYVTIGKFAGFEIKAIKKLEGNVGALFGAQKYEFKFYPSTPTRGITHLIQTVSGLDDLAKAWQSRIDNLKKNIPALEKITESKFENAEELSQKRARHKEVMDILNPPKEQNISEEDDGVQYQQRSETITDREILEMATEEIQVDNLSNAEKDALKIFNERLDKLRDLQEKRKEAGERYRELQFGANGVKVDRKEAAEVLSQMHALDDHIQRATSSVLSVEDKKVLKDVLHKARGVVEKMERRHGDEKLARYRQRRNSAEAVKKYRSRIIKDVSDMTKWVQQPDNKDVLKHVPDVLKESVIPFLSSIDMTSKRALRGGEATKADRVFQKQLEDLQAALANAAKTDDRYSGFLDLPVDFQERLNSMISTVRKLTEDNHGEYILNRMDAGELKDLSEIVRNLKALVKECDRLHNNAMFNHVYDAGEDSIGYLGSLRAPSSRSASGQVVNQFLFWQNIRPAYGFERFGKGGMAIWEGLRKGQAQMAFDADEIIKFSEEAYTADEAKKWEQETLEFELEDGTVKIPVSHAMSFYELSKRPHALNHIISNAGGIRVATFKDGKKLTSDTGHRLTMEDVNEIVDALSPRQKEVADKLQQYMSKVGGKWRNEINFIRFGEEAVLDEHYFPISSDGRHLESTVDQNPSAASLYALLNMSFNKPLTEGANNRIILYSIFDVFANHMTDMAQYHSMALPVLDALRWFNYRKTKLVERETADGKIVTERETVDSVRDQMSRAYGGGEETKGSGKKSVAENFIINILRGYNGTEAQGSPMDSRGMKHLHKYNRAQVAFNLRSVIQQPLAITRAGMVMDYRSVMKGVKLSPQTVKRNIAEMQEHSGIALWKSLGFYDVNISRGLTSIIKHDTTKTQEVIDFGLMGAEKADELTWAAMWAAAKEQIAKKGITPESENYWDSVTDLFETNIYKTQVVDSILTKSEFMRDKGFFARAVGSFMSEPTTTASMLLNAFEKYRTDIQQGYSKQAAWQRNAKNIGRTAYVYAVGAVLLAAVQAIADAWRDDDDYMNYAEKWADAFKGNTIDELSPFNKLPIIADAYDAVKELLRQWTDLDVYGNPPQSVIMQWYDSLAKASEIIHDKITGEKTGYTWWGGIYKLLQAASGMAGLPFATATREIVSAWNNTIGSSAPSLKLKTYEPSERSQITNAYVEGYLSGETTESELYDFYISEGSTPAEAKSSVASTIASALKPGYMDGDTTREEAVAALKPYGKTGEIRKWDFELEHGFSWSNRVKMYRLGKLSKDDLVKNYMEIEGKSKEDAGKYIRYLDLQWANQNMEITQSFADSWFEKGKPAGLTLREYRTYMDRKSGLMKKEDIIGVINSMRISSAKKDALYRAQGYAESTLDEAPWH